MENAVFFNHIEQNELNKKIISSFESFSKKHDDIIIYLIQAPLGEDFHYDYQEKVIVVLSPGYKIVFLDLAGEEDFDDYFDDFVSDLGFISNKYRYQDYIGRTRVWKEELLSKYVMHDEKFDVETFFENNKLPSELRRKSELIISLLTGCINDVQKIGLDQPITMLEKVKNKIVLFDAEQTRFIYKEYYEKVISVQGLSGTGKTELLLHKLKDLYTKDDKSKIFFTCHNIALAKKLHQRVPSFFDFMKVDKQIKWNERLWVTHAWGSLGNYNSGLYSYICGFYGLPFYRYNSYINYQYIFSKVLAQIKSIPADKFEPCLDYILIDESQDFPDVFFELCKKIVKHKIYAAGDVFQDIFETIKDNPRDVDIILNRCYRTDPRTLMFAHGIGLGLFEPKKLNWFDKEGWERLGYKVDAGHSEDTIILSRYPIHRFEDIKIKSSVEIINNINIDNIIRTIRNLIDENSDIHPDDIAIIFIDDNKEIYSYIDKLSLSINRQLNWLVARGYETKEVIRDHIYITNPNNVKGLEFPFVICITNKIIDSYRYRNTLYTMLTRSFLKSFLMVENSDGLEIFSDGLHMINSQSYIETKIPTSDERKEIEQTLLKYQDDINMSYKDFLESIFEEIKISDVKTKERLEEALLQTSFDKFDREKTMAFINANKSFY